MPRLSSELLMPPKQHKDSQQQATGEDGAASEPKRRKPRKIPAHLHFAGLKFGNWCLPPSETSLGEAPAALKGTCEVRVTFAAAGGKVVYEFPFSSPSHPGANRALIEFPLTSINAIEVDDEGAYITFLLSAPPCTYIGQETSTYVDESQETVQTTHFDTVQYDFSNGPVKACKNHTLYLGVGDHQGHGGRGSRGGGRGGRGGRGGSGAGGHATVSRFVSSMSQDERLADIIEQERQAEPGGHFATHEIEASYRQALPAPGDPGRPKARRRSAAADTPDGPPRRKRVPKALKGMVTGAGNEDDDGDDAGQDDGPELEGGRGMASQTLELGARRAAGPGAGVTPALFVVPAAPVAQGAVMPAVESRAAEGGLPVSAAQFLDLCPAGGAIQQG